MEDHGPWFFRASLKELDFANWKWRIFDLRVEFQIHISLKGLFEVKTFIDAT